MSEPMFCVACRIEWHGVRIWCVHREGAYRPLNLEDATALRNRTALQHPDWELEIVAVQQERS